MPFLRRFAPAAVRRGRRRSAADVQRVLHPGGALVLHDVDGAFVFALRAALAMGLVAVPVVLAGRPDLAVYAMLGSFTSTFGRNLPYARRARVLALVALAMTACVACGSALAAWARPEESAAGAAVVVAATALVAGVAKYVCDATRLSGLGAVMVLFSFAVAAHASPAPADILPYTAMAAAGAAPAWILGMLGLLIHPDRPQRLAVATALRRVAALLEARAAGTEVPGRTRHRATVAVLDAYRSLGQPPPARRTVPRHDTLLLRSADRSWALLVGAARWAPGEQRSAALHLRGQARLLTGRRHGIPPAPGTPGQPVRPQGRQDPSLGEEEPCRAVLHSDLQLVGQPDRSPFRPLRQFTIANSHHRNHSVQTRALHAYLRRRNTNSRHPDILAAQRRERARIRSEKGIRWGGRPLPSQPERSDEIHVVAARTCSRAPERRITRAYGLTRVRRASL